MEAKFLASCSSYQVAMLLNKHQESSGILEATELTWQYLQMINQRTDNTPDFVPHLMKVGKLL